MYSLQPPIVPQTPHARRLTAPMTTCLLTMLALLAAGCGQRGPLYLPSESEATAEERAENRKREVVPAIDITPAKTTQTR